MKGHYPIEYFHNPRPEKKIEEIWDDIDAYTGEYFEDEQNLHESIDFVIPLPPLEYEKRITKGVFFTQGCEYVLKLFPQLKEIFFCGAYTMWSNYSWCNDADFYLTCYENRKREKYYKNKYKNKKDIIFIPLQDADFTNEYQLYPTFNTPKDIDVIVVSSPLEVKNLPMIAQAIKYYGEKYGYKLKVTFALGDNNIIKNPDGSINISKLDDNRKTQLRQVFEILEDFDTIDYQPYISYDDIARYYTKSRCCVLGSLIEGKNRAIHEAMCCNTPIVVFKEHNQYARGNYPIFYGNSGEYAEKYTPESLAQAIKKVVQNPEKYNPRYNHLKYNGRKNFINKLCSYIPYYNKKNIPDYNGKIYENQWIDMACVANYQLSYHDFLYGKNPAIIHVRGIKAIKELLDFYFSRFNIR